MEAGSFSAAFLHPLPLLNTDLIELSYVGVGDGRESWGMEVGSSSMAFLYLLPPPKRDLRELSHIKHFSIPILLPLAMSPNPNSQVSFQRSMTLAPCVSGPYECYVPSLHESSRVICVKPLLASESSRLFVRYFLLHFGGFRKSKEVTGNLIVEKRWRQTC